MIRDYAERFIFSITKYYIVGIGKLETEVINAAKDVLAVIALGQVMYNKSRQIIKTDSSIIGPLNALANQKISTIENGQQVGISYTKTGEATGTYRLVHTPDENDSAIMIHINPQKHTGYLFVRSSSVLKTYTLMAREHAHGSTPEYFTQVKEFRSSENQTLLAGVISELEQIAGLTDKTSLATTERYKCDQV